MFKSYKSASNHLSGALFMTAIFVWSVLPLAAAFDLTPNAATTHAHQSVQASRSVNSQTAG